jgi:anaerobic ribonucleoside-triphosphate reductase
MQIKKRNGTVILFDANKIIKAIEKVVLATTLEIEKKESEMLQHIIDAVDAQLAESAEQIERLRTRLRKLKAYQNSIISKIRGVDYYRAINFLKRILSRTKTTIEAILFIKGAYEIIILVQNYIASKHTSLSLERS